MLGLQEGEAGRGGEVMERSLEINPANVAARFNLGHVRQLQGRLEEAITQYREVLALDAGHAPACYNLGVVCRQLGRRADALAYFKQAVALRPEFAEGLYGLGHPLPEEDPPQETAAAVRRAS